MPTSRRRSNRGLYGPKTQLQNEDPSSVSRCASVRTPAHKLIVRPDGQSEFYDCKADPGLAVNLIDDPAHAAEREALRDRLLAWYLYTSAAPPFDKDARGLPPFLKAPSFGVTPATFLDR
jgi:choline-sulfatase